VAEAGIAGYAFDTWWSLLAPAGTAPAIVTQLNGEVRRILALPDVRQRFAELGIDVLPSTPAELGEFTRSEIERLAKIIRQTGLKAE
jgi:tripartite-type tricarboxylate transporter receptor subunit TctC